jgi:hypothetical protein
MPPFGNRRKDVRRRVHIGAKWTAGRDAPLHDCYVTDISAGGARLMVDEPQAVPSEITLMIEVQDSPPVRCTVVWHLGHQVGVMFERPMPRLAELGTSRYRQVGFGSLKRDSH